MVVESEIDVANEVNGEDRVGKCGRVENAWSMAIAFTSSCVEWEIGLICGMLRGSKKEGLLGIVGDCRWKLRSLSEG
jgi:hypothetical protein